MIDPTEQLITLLYEYLLNEYDRRHKEYLDKLDYFVRRLYYGKPDKAFVSDDFLELIVLYNSVVVYDELFRNLWSIISSYRDSYDKYGKPSNCQF